MEQGQIFKAIKGTNNAYQAGSLGVIVSVNYNRTGKEKELKKGINADGYEFVNLCIEGKRQYKLVHRLIAETFIPNPDNKPQVNHRFGIRTDNRVSELEWATNAENTQHGYDSNGREQTEHQIGEARKRFSGEQNPKSKLNEAEILSIRRLRQKGLSMSEIGERHGISKSQVSSIVNFKSWK